MPTFIEYKCAYCYEIFNKELRQTHKNNKNNFCSKNCAHNFSIKKHNLHCTQCNKKFLKTNAEFIKSQNHFCSRSCAAKYNNTHKTSGNRRSKLEVWLEEKLSEFYKEIIIKYNYKGAINSELDIYIPKFNLAFEINGIFHYKPIYGNNKLLSIQNNDKIKLFSCAENNIDLIVIDASALLSFNAKEGEKYLEIIKSVINNKIY